MLNSESAKLHQTDDTIRCLLQVHRNWGYGTYRKLQSKIVHSRWLAEWLRGHQSVDNIVANLFVVSAFYNIPTWALAVEDPQMKEVYRKFHANLDLRCIGYN